MKITFPLLAAASLLFLTGCVTGHRDLSLDVPTGNAPAATKSNVYITTVTDNRDFQNKPSDPSTPSVDGDVNATSAAEKDRLIGRQRNGFGHAMGDIRLVEGDSVTHRVRTLVSEGFRRSGFNVVSDPAGAIPVTVSVDKLWAWSTPGFTVLTFEVKMAVKVTLTAPTSTPSFTVVGYGINHGQVAKDGNWKEAFEPAFEDFLANFKREIDQLDLR